MRQILQVASDGLALAVETFGGGPPLIFGHGLTGNRHVSRAQLAPLAEHYRVIIFDQRGHGDSTPVTEPARYDPAAMAGDMAAILDVLGCEEAVVGGESMGSAIALLFALRWPERAHSLLLTGPAFGDQPNPDRERIRAIGQAIAEVGLDAFLAAAADRQGSEASVPPEVLEFMKRMYRSHDPASLATACQTVVDWTLLSDLAAVERLAMPVCILAWPGDPLHPFSLAQRLADRFPNGRLETIPDLVHIFADPATIGRHYLQFLAPAAAGPVP